MENPILAYVYIGCLHFISKTLLWWRELRVPSSISGGKGEKLAVFFSCAVPDDAMDNEYSAQVRQG
ncbi:MAG: hypothetical protein JMM76_03445 [Candidatus Xiphinematobacter sp.]|nr:MAG: hypothetical protein JMM79_03520 [Candidatus Xiphinematobacter sp.]QQY09031.1 MAG: hypothetical protein JMM76_03445 [Candidatus Xiphinematobacter sp.]QQY11250.1 MAG: hypothetical protein JMM77_03500 [Candidatus Xiphinematobacter sp.]